MEMLNSRPKETELEKLSLSMAKILKELDKTRTTVREDGWQTQKHAKKSGKWDYYARKKFEIVKEIEDSDGSEKDKKQAREGVLHLK
jgi:hypothetical protein